VGLERSDLLFIVKFKVLNDAAKQSLRYSAQRVAGTLPFSNSNVQGQQDLIVQPADPLRRGRLSMMAALRSDEADIA
jgi:hypothetical protein